jgi:CBS domain-containing protein
MTELVQNIMKHQVITVDSSVTVKDAAKMMEDTGVGCVVVMEQNIAIGILSERDFVRRVVAHEKPLSTPVKEVM